jgi:hypothetical protein
MMEALLTSETSVYCNDSTGLYVPERSHFQKQFVFLKTCKLFFIVDIID